MPPLKSDNIPELLLQLAGHFIGPSEPVEVRRSRWAGWLFCVIAALFLILGLWQLAEFCFGPVLAPLLAAAAAALSGLAFLAYSRYAARRRKVTPTNLGPLLHPKMLLAAAEVLLAPRALRRTVFSSLLLNFVNRRFFK